MEKTHPVLDGGLPWRNTGLRAESDVQLVNRPRQWVCDNFVEYWEELGLQN